MAYPLPTDLINNGNGLLSGFGAWAYTVTNGFIWTGFLLGFCLILYIASSKFGGTRAFGFASFIGLMGAIFLAIAKLMPWWIASVFILTGAVGLWAMIVSER